RRFARSLDGLVVIIEPEEARLRKSLRHQQRGCALAAANVGHARACLEFRFHALKRGNPLTGQVSRIRRSEKLLAAMEDAFLVFVPAHSLACAEAFRYVRYRRKRAQSQFEG